MRDLSFLFEDDKQPKVCPCGSSRTVWVQSHTQCSKCGRVLESCCEGASVGDGGNTERPQCDKL